MAVPLTLKLTYLPPKLKAGIVSTADCMARTNDPVFPRVTLSVLWIVITGDSAASPAVAGGGHFTGPGLALMTGASANASATIVMHMLYRFFMCFYLLSFVRPSMNS